MLIWQGFGILAAIIPFVAIVVVTVIFSAIQGSGTATANSSAIVGVGLILSAPLIYLVGKRLDARPGRTMIDKATGQEVVLRESHTMFFLRLRWWAWIAAILGALVLVVAVTS